MCENTIRFGAVAVAGWPSSSEDVDTWGGEVGEDGDADLSSI